MEGYLLRHNKDVNRDLWEKLLYSSDFGSPFQTPAFFDFYNEVDGYSADVFAVEADCEYLCLMVITLQKEKGFKSFFSKRGIIYGGPLLRDKTDGLEFLLNSIKIYYSGIIYLESRNLFHYGTFQICFKNSGWKYLPYLNIKNHFNQGKLEDVLRRFKYNRRREISQSLAQGAICSEVKSEDEILRIYDILSITYLKRVRLPLPSSSFFVKFWESGIMKVFAVFHKGKIIGGSFCPILQGKAIYTMYYCGLRKYHSRIFPTHLAILAAIEYGLKANCQYLDFMGAGKQGKEYGVRKYKAEFGGDISEEGRFLLVNKPVLFWLGKLWIKMQSLTTA